MSHKASTWFFLYCFAYPWRENRTLDRGTTTTLAANITLHTGRSLGRTLLAQCASGNAPNRLHHHVTRTTNHQLHWSSRHAPQRKERGQQHRHLLDGQERTATTSVLPKSDDSYCYRRVAVIRSATRRGESVTLLFSLEVQTQRVTDKCGDSSWHGVSAFAITANIDCSTGRVPIIVFFLLYCDK